MVADLVVKGKIFTSNKKQLFAEAMAVKDGKILYVGEEKEVSNLIGEDTKVLETGQGMALAAVGEGHAHVSSTVSYIFEVDLAPYKVSDILGYQEEIRKFMKQHPDQKVVCGRGFLNGVFPGGMATKEYLDEISTEIPLVMVSEDGHSKWCNSKALEVCGINKDTPDIKDGVVGRVSGSHEPNGAFRETAMSYLDSLEPKYTTKDYKEAICYYQKMAKEYGIGNVYEPMGGDDWRLKVQAYKELAQENRLEIFTKVGIYIEPDENWSEKLEMIEEVSKEIKNEYISFESIKIFIDGVVEGHTAWLKEEYADAPGDCCGSMWETEVLNELCATAQSKGLSIHIHAIGDGAVSQALDAFAYSNEKTKIEDNRNTITHVQLVSKEDFSRFAKLNVIAATNPYWHYRQQFYFEELEVKYLGRTRAEKEYPMKSFLDSGVTITEASDWPVSVPCNPWRGLEYAVTRQPIDCPKVEPLNPKERMSVEEMLVAMTLNGAYQVGVEENTGSIEVGKDANFIIINQDLFHVEPYTLHETTVVSYFRKGGQL